MRGCGGAEPRWAAARRRSLHTAELNLGRNERGELMLKVAGARARWAAALLPRARALHPLRCSRKQRSAVPRRQHSPGQRRPAAALPCPPDRLRRFLHTLRLKLAVAPGPGPGSARTQLLGPRPRDFISISPVQPEELRRAAATRVTDTRPVKRPTEPPAAGAKPAP